MGSSARPCAVRVWAMVAAMMDRDSRPAAWDLLCQWTQSDSLRRHMLAVEAAMRAYALHFGEDVELWGLTGLLHDLDYERHPDMSAPDGHPRTAMALLTEHGYPDELVRAIGSHADYLGVPRRSRLERTLFAVDELSGFILAVAYVRPGGLTGMTAQSVKKKLKSAGFAAAVNREELRQGADALGVDFDTHVSFVIAALLPHAEVLLPGTAEAGAG
jgi:putative nucleotidyltransferase with HDIG domain